MRQAVDEDFRRESFLEELLPPRVKELESPKLSQYIVLPQGEVVPSTGRDASAGLGETPKCLIAINDI